MDVLEAPAVVNQLKGEPVEQFRLLRFLALQSKVVGCGDDALAQVVLPYTVDDDPRQQVSGTGFRVSDPVRDCAAALLRARHLTTAEHLQETQRGDLALLPGITALEEVGLLVEVRDAAAAGVVAHRLDLVAVTADHDLGYCLLPSRVKAGELALKLAPFLVERLVELEQPGAQLVVELALGGLDQGVNLPGRQFPGTCLLAKFKPGRLTTGDGQAQPADVVPGVVFKLEREHQFLAGPAPGGVGQLEDGRVVLAELWIQCPGRFRVVIDCRGNWQPPLLEGRPGVGEFDGPPAAT